MDVFLFIAPRRCGKLDRLFLISSSISFFWYSIYVHKIMIQMFYLLQVLWTSNGVRLGYMMRMHAKQISCCKNKPTCSAAILRGHNYRTHPETEVRRLYCPISATRRKIEYKRRYHLRRFTSIQPVRSISET